MCANEITPVRRLIHLTGRGWPVVTNRTSAYGNVDNNAPFRWLSHQSHRLFSLASERAISKTENLLGGCCVAVAIAQRPAPQTYPHANSSIPSNTVVQPGGSILIYWAPGVCSAWKAKSQISSGRDKKI